MDLAVDASLDETNAHLKAIHAEFSGAGEQTRDDQHIWGQSDLHHAMQAFTDDWWVHRKKIDGRLDKLSQKVEQCCQAWTDADKQLTDSLAAEGDDA